MTDNSNTQQLNEEHYKFRTFGLKSVGKYKVSIQASYMHYCKPRLTLKDIDQYSEYEVDIFLNDIQINPKYDNLYKDKSWAKYWRK